MSSVHHLYDIRVFHKEAKSLAQSGYEVSLVIQHDREEIIDGIRIIPIQTPSSRSERLFKTIKEVYWKASKENADIYHFHDPELILAGLWLKWKGKTVIYDIHENVARQIKSKKWLPLRSLVSKIYRSMELLLCRAFPLVLAEDSYDRLYPESWRKVTVRNFPSLSLFPEPSQDRKFDLVYLGGVTRARGINTVVEAISILKNQGVSVQFECIGPINPDYERELSDICKTTGISDQVTFYGRMNAIEAYEMVRNAKIGMALLKPYPNYIASYPTKIFEYMALKVPVITSNFPLYQEVIEKEKCGFTLHPEEPERLAKVIFELVNDPQMIESMGSNGRQAVENKYNWDSEAKKLLQLYAELSHSGQKEEKGVNHGS